MNSQRRFPQQGQLLSVIIVSLLAIAVIVGLSLKKRPRIQIVQATAEQALPNDSLIGSAEPENLCPEIVAVFHEPGRLDILTGDAVFTSNRDSLGWGDPLADPFQAEGRQLNCIYYDNDRLLVGGDRLTIMGTDYLEVFSDHDFGAPINVILKFGEAYLVGTTNGLHYYYPGGDPEPADTVLKADILVSRLAEDQEGLWIGTFGNGLWRFDGHKWQRRYLTRDTSIFDFVSALNYSYPFLWVGTPSGIFRYDGGTWKQLFAADSSETYEVNCFLPLALHTYIGTEQGLFVYAGDSLTAVPEFADERIIGLCKDQKDVLVATRDNGIFNLSHLDPSGQGKEAVLRPEQLTADRNVMAATQ